MAYVNELRVDGGDHLGLGARAHKVEAEVDRLAEEAHQVLAQLCGEVRALLGGRREELSLDPRSHVRLPAQVLGREVDLVRGRVRLGWGWVRARARARARVRGRVGLG